MILNETESNIDQSKVVLAIENNKSWCALCKEQDQRELLDKLSEPGLPYTHY